MDKMWKRRQLFHATDFQSLMYPNFIICRILGIFPYKINASTFETSRSRYILQVFPICVVCIGELMILREIFITKTVNFGDVTETLDSIFFFTFNGFVTLITCFLSGPKMRVLQAMLDTSTRLPPESYQKLSRWIHVKDILGTFFLVAHGLIRYYKIREKLFIILFSAYIVIVVFEMDMQYMNCVCVLKACFKRINDNLVHMQKIIVNDTPYAPKMIWHTQKNQLLLVELRMLKKQHLIISNTVQMLNVMFSLQLLVSITLTFIEITYELYSHLLRWQNGLSFILDDEISDMFFLTCIAYDFIKLILIVWACETNKNQAFEISTTIHDVLNRTSDMQIKDEVKKI
ncbi:PREDICTED: uncharacterized protein LOC105460873 [Wasmannia auropunctata]|uniref:uncharacterized protein LOC105460873 n=1 Tax=Wasmannia auropunctata TaxID=64793 RepID=UPI0005EF767B|nr:PREDICTED: uncharacterized protein LOC105460873 [Wasmannia auropunctata]